MLTQVLIVVVAIALISLLIWAGICILTIRHKAEEARVHDQRYTPGETIAGFVVFGIIGQVLLWAAAWIALNATATATVMLLQNRAQEVYKVAVEYAADEDHDKLSTLIGCTNDKYTYPLDSVESEILRKLSNDGNFWFAVKVDNDGNVVGAYYAHHELTKKDLHSVDSKEQKKLLLNPFGGEKAVTGAWTMTDEKLQSRFQFNQGTEAE